MIPEIAIYVCLGISLFFSALGAIGILRFPDFYTRLHPATKCTTFGGIFACFAAIIFGIWKGIDGMKSGDMSMFVLSIHVFIVLVCLLLTNPTGAHAIARAAHRSGVYPKTWGGKPVEVDVLYKEKEKMVEVARLTKTDNNAEILMKRTRVFALDATDNKGKRERGEQRPSSLLSDYTKNIECLSEDTKNTKSANSTKEANE